MERKEKLEKIFNYAIGCFGLVGVLAAVIGLFVVLKSPTVVIQLIEKVSDLSTSTPIVIEVTRQVNISTEIPTLYLTPLPQPTNPPLPSPTLMPEVVIPTSGSLLFFDDFNDGNADGWIPVAETWNVVEGKYICIGGSEVRSFIGEDYWGDYSVSAKVKLISGNINAGVLGRAKDADHYYHAQLFNGRARIYIQNGGWRELANVPYATTNGRWYKITLEFRGTEIKMYVDDVLVASAEDAVILNGKIGLMCDGSQMYVDDVQVTTP